MKEIAAQELTSRLERGEALAVVDIREEHEYAGWHIAGSQNVPVYEALRRGDLDALTGRSEAIPRDRPVVAVCRAGYVSLRAAEVLCSLGFDATSLRGGIRGWGAVWTEAPIALRGRPQAQLVQIRRNGKGCLSYLFGASGEAAVVDPSVEVQAYLDAAARRNLTIKHVIETHVHADHLSRARELCQATGATLTLPPNERVTFPYTAARDGETIDMGGIPLEVISTPGHTSESTSYLLASEALLSGDTLFTGAVGRPDLERGDAGAEKGARMLHRSLHERLLRLADDVGVYPGHHSAAIGFDGKPLGAPLGQVRKTTPALALDEEAFVRKIVSSLSAKPGNFESIIAINEGKAGLDGAEPLDIEAGPNCCAVG